MKIKQRITVEFNFDIIFTRNLFALENPVLEEMLGVTARSKVLIFLDSCVSSASPGLEHRIGEWFDAHPRCGSLAAPILLVPGGERCKNDFEYHKVMARNMRITKLDRHSFVIIIGGGAVLDAVGFVASITHRGIRHLRVPTTVLSQNDSGIGVKNGINLYGAKNYFGTFTPPYGVINDFDFLNTLTFRDWLAGIAEAFKVAIIKDRAFLIDLASSAPDLRSRDEKAMERLIFRCAQLHAEHIATSGDPFEYGSARPLDFGHWSGHYLEVLSGYKLRHGEAIAIGIALDMIIARNRCMISSQEFDLVIRGLLDCGFTLWHPLLEKRENPENSICEMIFLSDADKAATSQSGADRAAPSLPGTDRAASSTNGDTKKEYHLAFEMRDRRSFSFPHSCQAAPSLCIFNGLEEFRQHLGGNLTIAMPKPLGHLCLVNSIAYEEVEQAIREMKNSWGREGRENP